MLKPIQITLVILLWNTSIVFSAQSINAVEIYSGGEEYKSIQDYKAKRIRSILQETFAVADAKKIDALFKEVQQDNPETDWENITNDQLQAVIERLQAKHQELTPAPDQDKDLKEMEELWQNYLKEHKNVESITIDKNKVKTIILSPKSKE